jgi:hypothetical protein
MQWFIDEISDYKWRKNAANDMVDEPIDKNDHAMDMMKYALTHRPPLAGLLPKLRKSLKVPDTWEELDTDTGVQDHAPWRHRA